MLNTVSEPAALPATDELSAVLLNSAKEAADGVEAGNDSSVIPPAAEEPSPAEVIARNAEQIDWQQAARAAIAQAEHLPPAVRAHLTRKLDDSSAAVRDALGQPLIPVAEAIAALSAALPTHWLADPRTLQTANHPSGDGFFEDSERLSDARAAQIVRQQFAATGFLKADATTP